MKKSLILTFALALGLCVSAKVTLPQLLSDGMVVQRSTPVVLWGKADPGETVEIKAERGANWDRKVKSKSYKQAVATVTADADGRWQAELPAMQPGASYTITINDITLHDVMPGDVFICSGQSNMELPIRRVTDMFYDEVSTYTNPYVREFAVPNDYDFHGPLDDVKPTAWKDIRPGQALNFSALAYFFGKSLYERTGVPVGLIRTCWGGTPIEAWISEESLASYPRAINEKRIYEDDAYRAHIKTVEGENYRHWESVMNTADPGLNGTQKWYDPAYDDSAWQTIDLLDTSWGTDGLNPINGSHWLRKDVEIPASMAGQPATIRLGCIVDADSVWVNGTFVGNITYQYPPRIYPIPEGVLKEGKNVVTVRVISQNGMPHFVPEKPYKIIQGDNSVSLEGDWRYHLGTPMVHGPGMEFWCYKPVVLYNAMIAPLTKYPVTGAVWYQGESNVGRHNEYSSLLQTLMNDWREAFADEDMPFYIVELADFMAPSETYQRAQWAKLRQAQAAACEATEGATLIHNSDLGEWNDIHPLDKKTLGTRVADAVYSDMTEKTAK